MLMLTLSEQLQAATDTNARVIAGPDIGQVIMALCFVLVLVFILAFLSKLLPAMRVNSGHNIKIIETMPLTNRDKLMIVEVNQQQLLVGMTAQGMQTLHVLDTPVTASDVQDDSFAQRLVAVMQGNKNA